MKRKTGELAAEWEPEQGTWHGWNGSQADWEREYRKRLSQARNAGEVWTIWQEASQQITMNEIHLTTALKGCQGDPKIAMRIFRKATDAGVAVNAVHFACVLKVPGTPTKKLLSRMKEHSVEGNRFTWNAALTGCAAQDAWRLFEQIDRPDRYAIASLLKKCTPEEVPKALKIAKKHGIQPDRAILNSAATASPGSFLKILKQIPLKPDLQFFNIVLNRAVDFDLPDVARKAFVELKAQGLRPDSFSLNRFLAALLRQGPSEGSEARSVLETHRKLIDKHTWTILGKSLVESGRANEALQIYRQERRTFGRLKPDVAFFNVYLGACAKAAAMDLAQEIWGDLSRFAKADLVSHHCMIQVYAAVGQLDSAEEELERMEANGIEATARTYNSLIDAASKAADFKRARRLLQAMQERELEADVFTFNILINSAANMGRCKRADSYFRKMQELGISPDAVTAVSLLNAYSHGGEAEKALAFFEKLPSFGLEPTTSCINALVDCLSRSGLFDAAWERVEAAEAKGLADTVTYMAFLGACRNLKSKLHAKEAFARLKEVADKPALASAYVLLSELYESLGKHGKAQKLEAERVASGLVKQRGESYLHLEEGEESGLTVRTFTAGPVSASEEATRAEGAEVDSELCTALAALTRRLRAAGHEPDLASASARHESAKEKALSLESHSEKKALALALHRRKSLCSAISITKNLRVCNDCHGAMMVASRAYSCEIHLRDRSRWHIFKDGMDPGNSQMGPRLEQRRETIRPGDALMASQRSPGSPELIPAALARLPSVEPRGQRHRFVDVCHALCAELSVRPGPEAPRRACLFWQPGIAGFLAADVDAMKTAMMRAAEDGRLDDVKDFVERGEDVNAKSKAGYTAMMWAASNGHLEVVKYLAEQGADVDAKDDDGWTAMMWAAGNGHLEVVKYLAEQGADVDAKDDDGWTAMMLAASRGQLEVVKYLAEERGADVDAKDDGGNTAMMFAASRGQLEVVKYLAERGASVDARAKYGATAMIWAASLGQLEVVKYFVEEQGADVNYKTKHGSTVMFQAGEYGHLRVVKYLTEQGADVWAVDELGVPLWRKIKDKDVVQWWRQQVTTWKLCQRVAGNKKT
ncbi:unnamed protein product [Symbiodinium necroappetens]|uniref:Pentatricopeptide repeat-containing protein, chloroplastic n=1 Tax=Symbiodinium necroappetens TaxID=1628268 RepID=A0A812P1Q9_9DINO|nr:unnamed protein product [Symbiodinium necroappetens]